MDGAKINGERFIWEDGLLGLGILSEDMFGKKGFESEVGTGCKLIV